MDTNRAFAYLLLACDMNHDLEIGLSRWYQGDIIEAFSEGEDQAQTKDDLWSFGWEEVMDRIAPVQLTRGLAITPLITKLLGNGVTLRDDIGEYGGSILHWGPTQLSDVSLIPRSGTQSDRSRFEAVLDSTLALSRKRNSGILYVGGSGWYYEMEVPKPQQALMTASGMQFTTRHI